MARNVLVRIKRMGDQWATCGIGVEAPADMKDRENVYDLCTKLVPGQCIRLPDTHRLARHHLCEVVRRPEKDEFERPWVFKTAEHAMLADPSRAGLSADEIINALAMLDGAREHAEAAAESRFRERDNASRDHGFYVAENDSEGEEPDDDDDEREEDPDTANERRSGNRENREEIKRTARPRSVAEDLKNVEEEDEREEEEKPEESTSTRRRRASRAR